MSMHVLFAAAEAVPFVKVGGLADVVGSLPKALKAFDIQPVVVLPRYGCIATKRLTLSPIQLSSALLTEPIAVWQTTVDDIPVYLLEHPCFAEASGPYAHQHPQELFERFRVFNHGVQAFLQQHPIGQQTQVLHIHDWHTALLPKQLAMQHSPSAIKTVLTIHNLAYQGLEEARNSGADTSTTPPVLNWLAEGLRHADWLTTVSPTYAREILEPPNDCDLGCGLGDLLRARSHQLTGILNGLDMDLWNPETDPALIVHYSADDVTVGKPACKMAIQQTLGLPLEARVPLFVMISRLAEQKGLDILLPALGHLAEKGGQWAILGSGEAGYEAALKQLEQRHENIRFISQTNLALGQQLYAGGDIFLMPSRFEPCGLGQLIAMRYGTVPVAHRVGGLADTIIDVRDCPQTGNGYLFNDYTPKAFIEAVEAAWQAYQPWLQQIGTTQQPSDAWLALQQHGMRGAWGWTHRAVAYATIYQALVNP